MSTKREYSVTVTQQVTESMVVTVHACSRKDAKKKAMELVKTKYQGWGVNDAGLAAHVEE